MADNKTSVTVEINPKDCHYEAGIQMHRAFVALVLNKGFEQMRISLYAEEVAGSASVRIIGTGPKPRRTLLEWLTAESYMRSTKESRNRVGGQYRDSVDIDVEIPSNSRYTARYCD
jgi:hypothetical protein